MRTVGLSDLVATGPETLAGRYLRLYWQPVLRAEDLAPNRAVPVRIMSEDVTVYRGAAGDPHIVAGRCAHRKTLLHTGSIVGDTIRCRYHGWQFAPDGRCVHQPGEREGFTATTNIAAFPAAEYLGLIWGYFGSGDPPPMRRYPDFERPGLLSVGPSESWPCNLWNRLDNAPDLMHVLYTHEESIKREFSEDEYLRQEFAPADRSKAAPKITAIETEFGVETTVEPGAGQTSYFHFLMPNTNAVAARVSRLEGYLDGTRRWVYTMFIRVPIDDASCVSYHLSLIDVHGDEAARYIELRNGARAELAQSDPNALIVSTGEAVLAGKMRIKDMDPKLNSYYTFLIEDYACQVGQGTIADRQNERLGSIDQGTILLRKIWLRELEALAEGRPLKTWHTPAGLADKSTPQPSLPAAV